jgi:hypothetical protein
MPVPALAQGFPTTAAGERPVLGLPALHEFGTWERDPSGLRLLAGEGTQAWWLAQGSDFADGVVRARVVLGTRPDLTVLVRASVPVGYPELLSAWAVSVEGTDLVLYRYEQGVVRNLGARVAIPPRTGRRAIELVLALNGPFLMVTAWDADTLDLVATLTTTDGGPVAGLVGVRANPKQGEDTRVESLTYLPAGAEGPAEPDLFGDQRVVRLTPSDAARIPKSAAFEVLDRTPNEVIGRTDPRGLELIRRAAIVPMEVRAESSWADKDSRYRQARGKAPVPKGDSFDLSISYKDNEMVESLLRAWHKKYPKITAIKEIGRTAQGRPILAFRITDRPDKDEDEPSLLFVAAHHGGELLSIEYALDAIDQTLAGRDGSTSSWITELDLWFVPLVNPDGNHNFLNRSTAGDRKNARDLLGDGVIDPWDGVDLNRNYPFQWGALGRRGSSPVPTAGTFRGPAEGSEAETKAIMALADRLRPAALISWHTYGTMILSPYTVDETVSPKPDVPWKIAEELSKAAGRQGNGKMYAVRRNMYAVDGTDQDWHRWAHGTVAYIVEGTHHNPRDATIRQRSIEGVRPVFTTLVERARTGPRLTVIARSGGKPVQVPVRIQEWTLSQGEVWSTRAHDGRLDLLLAEPAAVTVVVEAPGFAPVRRTVEVRGPTTVDIPLKKP